MAALQSGKITLSRGKKLALELTFLYQKIIYGLNLHKLCIKIITSNIIIDQEAKF